MNINQGYEWNALCMNRRAHGNYRKCYLCLDKQPFCYLLNKWSSRGAACRLSYITLSSKLDRHSQIVKIYNSLKEWVLERGMTFNHPQSFQLTSVVWYGSGRRPCDDGLTRHKDAKDTAWVSHSIGFLYTTCGGWIFI
jgi:hypothetical protein